jgi:hypothetical protein
MTGKTEEKRKTAMLGVTEFSSIHWTYRKEERKISIILLFCYFGYAIISSIIEYSITRYRYRTKDICYLIGKRRMVFQDYVLSDIL